MTILSDYMTAIEAVKLLEEADLLFEGLILLLVIWACQLLRAQRKELTGGSFFRETTEAKADIRTGQHSDKSSKSI